MAFASDKAEDVPRVAIVTGSTRGIGRAIAENLAGAGYSVLVNGRDSATTHAAAGQLPVVGSARHSAFVFDVGDHVAVDAAYRRIFKEYGRLDVLVNNAGVLGDAFLGMIANDVAERTLTTNLRGALNNLQGASRLMMRRASGAIVNIASIVGIRGNPGQVLYSASKAGLLGLTLSAARELGPKGIRVNAVAPGVIDTEMIRHLSDQQLNALLSRVPLGRLGRPSEVADVVSFLVSEAAAYVSGQIVGVDGAMAL